MYESGGVAAQRSNWTAVHCPPTSPLGVSNLHRFGVSLAAVVHFQNVFVRTNQAQNRFHWNVFAATSRATCLAFQRDDFVSAIPLALAGEHRGLCVAHPDAVEGLLGIVETQHGLAGKWST